MSCSPLNNYKGSCFAAPSKIIKASVLQPPSKIIKASVLKHPQKLKRLLFCSPVRNYKISGILPKIVHKVKTRDGPRELREFFLKFFRFGTSRGFGDLKNCH